MTNRDLYNLVYKNDEEANDFINKHLKEFPVSSYNDITDIHPEVIQVKPVSTIVENINLLKNKKARDLLTDYFECKDTDYLLKKYKYKNAHVLSNTIRKLKLLIKKRLIKNIEKELALEVKKVKDKVLKQNVVKEMVLSSAENKRLVLKLCLVPYKNKLNYKFYDEDVLVLINKLRIINQFLSPLNKKRISKYNNLKDMNPQQFKFISEFCNKYRWVTEDGYLLPKVLDDALTNILSHTENLCLINIAEKLNIC